MRRYLKQCETFKEKKLAIFKEYFLDERKKVLETKRKKLEAITSVTRVMFLQTRSTSVTRVRRKELGGTVDYEEKKPFLRGGGSNSHLSLSDLKNSVPQFIWCIGTPMAAN
ncbi:hypothetical protein R1sor_021154 [Riccia sorocarpa]|uniref:Uncharacterized protein n=1 Tax=Riccia sorocarpa TaxID=122646 RepID=A0ABD3GGA4_9MARC